MRLTLVFLRRGEEVLLAMKKRGFGEGRWNGIGGKVEPGESVEQAMVRETKEEIGVDLHTYEQVGLLTFDEYFKGKPTLLNVTVFTATEWTGQPTETEEMAPAWFNISDVPYDDMWADDPYWLPQVLDGKKVTGTIKLDENDTVVDHAIEVIG